MSDDERPTYGQGRSREPLRANTTGRRSREPRQPTPDRPNGPSGRHGERLLRALVNSGDTEAFGQLDRSLFTRQEHPAFDAISQFVEQQGNLPSEETLRTDYHVDLPDAPEASSYYLERVHQRAIYNAIQANHRALNEALAARNMDAAVEALDRMKSDVDAARAWRTLATDPETVARIVESMGGSSLADLREREFDPVVDVVHGVVAPGLTLLAGDPKVGKSWLAMELSTSVALGQNALGSLPTVQGPVVHLALEDTQQAFKERVEIMGVDYPANVTVYFTCRRLDQGGLEDLERLLASERTQMLVIDTFNRVRREANDRMPIQQRDYGDLRGLKQLADQYGVAVVVIVHSRKGRGRDVIAETAGSHGLTGCADNVVMLRAGEGDEGATLRVTGRNIPEHTFNLVRDSQTMRWRVSGRDIARELNETDRRLYDYLVDHGRNSPAQLAEATGMNRNTVRTALARLAERGFVLEEGTTRDRAYMAVPEQIVLQLSEWAWEEELTRRGEPYEPAWTSTPRVPEVDANQTPASQTRSGGIATGCR